VINRNTKRIILLEFERTSDTVIGDTIRHEGGSGQRRSRNTLPFSVKGLNINGGWEVEVMPLVSGKRSVREKEWMEVMKTVSVELLGTFERYFWTGLWDRCNTEDVKKKICYSLSMRNYLVGIGGKFLSPIVV